MISAKVKNALRKSDLSSAITLLYQRAKDIGNYNLQTSLDEVEATYRAMLTYLLQGYVDTEISKRREDLALQLYIINDQADRLERIAADDKQSRYIFAYKSSKSHSLQNIQQRLEVELPYEEHDEEMGRLFNIIWTSDVWSKIDYEIASSILSSYNISVNDKAVFISAVTLSLMEMFDVKKFQLLFDAYLYPEAIISQRALVGLVITIRMYDARFETFPELKSRLSIYADDPRFIRELTDTLIMMQYSCITDKVTSKLQNDIFPTLMKKQDNINNMSLEELRKKYTIHGENPDWIDKKAEKSIKEMGTLQLEGADIYMSTFRYMKGYPFFNKFHHWFTPFDTKNPKIVEITNGAINGNGNLLSLILKNNAFCNSDLYSFCYMLNSLCAKDREFITGHVSEQFSEEDKELLSSIEIKDSSLKAKEECRKYIFDIYRVFVCYPFFNQFENPFKRYKQNAEGENVPATFSPFETKAFHFLTANRDEMLNMAEFFMRKEFYAEALEMFNSANPQPIEEDANIWQKIGFCRQKLGKEKSAYKAYILADELHPDSRWTMTHIAQLSQKMEIYDTAINYYDMLLLQGSENLRFITNKAICQMKSKLYEEAIKTLYQGYYLDENSIVVQQYLIECYIRTRQTEKACELIKRLISDEKCPNEVRILNALIAFKEKSPESAYYYIREAMSFFKEMENDGHSFNYYYNHYLSEYAEVLDINADTARMLLDSVNLDIR